MDWHGSLLADADRAAGLESFPGPACGRPTAAPFAERGHVSEH